MKGDALMANFMELIYPAVSGLQMLPAAEFAACFYGAVLVLSYQLLRSQKRKLLAFG